MSAPAAPSPRSTRTITTSRPNNVIADTLFGTLVALDGNFKPVPALAESWKVIDDHTWEFKLRPGVKFSDGTPFTPDDVVFTFQRIPTVLNSPSSFNYAVKPVERLEIVDPLTIRMHTKQPEPLLPYFLNGVHIISRKYGEGATTADYNSGKAAIGTGPYKLESVLLGDHVVFVRNENYWGPKPYWDRVNYRMIPNDASRTAALQAGDVDIIDQVSTRDVATLKKNPDLDIRAPAGQRLIYIYLDTEREQTPTALRPRRQAAGEEPAAGFARAQGALAGHQPRRHQDADHGRLLRPDRPAAARRRRRLHARPQARSV